MKPVQYFTDEYLEECKKMSLEQRLQFLEDFRQLQAPDQTSKLISIKIPDNLLQAFKRKCLGENIKYQSQIKKLMFEWVSKI